MIELKFDAGMTEAIEKGFKCSTFRREKHGWEGATFEVAGKTYRILSIVPTKFVRVVDDLYCAEGFDSPDEMHEWATMQYGKGYDIMMSGYVHFFARVPEAPK